jgi:prefoldin subunit 5
VSDREVERLTREVRKLQGVVEQLTHQVQDLQAASKFNGAYDELRTFIELADEPALWEKDR